MSKETIEKENREDGVDRWVSIVIERCLRRPDGSIDYTNRERLFRYDLPRWIFEGRRWVINWRVARLQCAYPKDNISPIYCFYDRIRKMKMELNATLNKVIAAKRKITEIKNEMQIAKDNFVPTLYEKNIEMTELWKKAELALRQREARLIMLQNQLQLEQNEKKADESI